MEVSDRGLSWEPKSKAKVPFSLHALGALHSSSLLPRSATQAVWMDVSLSTSAEHCCVSLLPTFLPPTSVYTVFWTCAP